MKVLSGGGNAMREDEKKLPSQKTGNTFLISLILAQNKRQYNGASSTFEISGSDSCMQITISRAVTPRIYLVCTTVSKKLAISISET